MTDPDPLAELLGTSSAFQEVKDRARQMLARATGGARLPAVLIQGETGTGKGLLARALHHASARARGPFVAVNCGAIPETLAESEFFGFARGAHSEARQAKIGLFQAADRGVIFLDEVGLLSDRHQVRLLKVLEDRQVLPVGSTRPVPVDVWVISATNADLRLEIEERRFRRDLYERLAVVTFTLPPLRQRSGDIVGLSERFLARACSEYGLRPKRLSADAKRRLLDYQWPGNVRELANVIERAALLVETEAIQPEHLELAAPAPVIPPAPTTRPALSRADRRQRILDALKRHGGNITQAATHLGVTRKTMRDWMRQEGLYPRGAGPETGRSVAAADQETPAAMAGPETAAIQGLGSGLRIGTVAGPSPSIVPDLPAPMLRDHAAIYWERRWITLLRVNLSSEDEQVASDMTRPLEAVADKVQTFGGCVIELGRTGLDAAFGLDPLEEAPQRAAYAALAILRARVRAREMATPGAVSRIALHAGSYLVARMGTSTQIDHDAKEAISAVLATLVATAGPDTIIASRTILPFLRRRFDLDGPVVAGIAGEGYRLLGRADRPAAFGTQISWFVGREAEIALLENRWRSATEGFGQIVGIVGDPGIGKSRLVWEFLHGGATRGGLVLQTAATALGRPTPYLAILELLRRYFGVEAGEGDSSVQDKVTRRIADLDPAIASARPAFLSLLDVATGDTAWDALDPTRRRQRTFDAIRRLILVESARQPLLLVFEDSHWADSETHALLEVLADSLPAARVLIVATFRPEYEHSWSRRTFYTQIRLDPLRGEAVDRFLTDVLGEHSSLDQVRATLVEWTGGNPFFIEETIRTLVETGVLDGKRGEYRAIRPLTSIAVPETVHEVLAARIARLPHSAVEVLQSAAVIGRRVSLDVLAGLPRLSAEDLKESLDLLQAREFLSETGVGEEREYTFRHALTQEVAYESLPDDQRCGLHAQIVDAVERVYPERLEEHVAELAHHALEGQRWEQAVRYLERAGARAFARSANTEAAACFEQALVALSHLPDSRTNQERAIDLHFNSRHALTPLAQAHRTLEHLREANRLAAALGDQRRRARALSLAANSLCLVADFTAAIEASQQASELARSLDDFPLTVAAGMYLGRACAGLGEYRRAVEVLGEVVASLSGERTRDYLGLPVLPAVFARSHLVLALADLGEFEEADRLANESTVIAESTRHPDTLLWAYFSRGVAMLTRGDVARAIAVLEHALELCRTADMPVYLALVSGPLGLAYAMAGRVADGLALAERAVQEAEARRQVALHAWNVLRLAETKLLAGEHAIAHDLVSRALSSFRERGERGGMAYALCLRGEIQAQRGDVGRARQLLGESDVLARELSMRALSSRCQRELTRLP